MRTLRYVVRILECVVDGLPVRGHYGGSSYNYQDQDGCAMHSWLWYRFQYARDVLLSICHLSSNPITSCGPAGFGHTSKGAVHRNIGLLHRSLWSMPMYIVAYGAVLCSDQIRVGLSW